MKSCSALKIFAGALVLLMNFTFTPEVLAKGNKELRLICPEPGSEEQPYYQRLSDGKEFSHDGPKDLAKLLKICYNMLIIEVLSSPGCGNGLIEGDETCEVGDLAGESCASQGWIGGGDLACGSTCQLDVSGCFPSCNDGILNGFETGLDCGGPDCQACSSPGPSCSDGILNGNESDTDCGGKDCVGCGIGYMCLISEDCTAGSICLDGECKEENSCQSNPNDPACS